MQSPPERQVVNCCLQIKLVVANILPQFSYPQDRGFALQLTLDEAWS
jgi:hypothetical protein